MALFEWNDGLSVGIEVIDTDHKLLVSLINLLDEAVADGQGKETTGSVLNTLYDYTDYHFAREEKMMQACHYPDLERHKKMHKALKSRVMEIRDDYAKGASAHIELDVLEFLKDWLTDHIMGRDKLYIAAMQEHRDAVDRAAKDFAENLDWMTDDDADDTFARDS